jgi:hypothetical protein
MRKSLVAALVVCLVPALALAGAPGTSLTNPGNGPTVPIVVQVAPPVQNAGDLLTYTSVATYEGANPGQKIYGFENSQNACNIAGINGPLNSNGIPGYFPADPGGAIAGLEMYTVNGAANNLDLVTIPGGFNGNPSCIVVANYFTDNPTYRTGKDGKANVSGMGGMLQSHFTAGNCRVDVFDTNGTTNIGSFTAACNNAGAFFGVQRTNGAIGGVNVFSLTNQAEGMDDIHHSPEPTTMVLLATGALALIRRRR